MGRVAREVIGLSLLVLGAPPTSSAPRGAGAVTPQSQLVQAVPRKAVVALMAQRELFLLLLGKEPPLLGQAVPQLSRRERVVLPQVQAVRQQ